MINDTLISELLALHKKMDAEGKLPSRQQLEQYYETFKKNFGPDALSRLDGEALLEKMHGSGNHDSMIYWLEFKNDEEFPGIFGGIAGGSALKFGVYRRADTGVWMTGSPQTQKEISVEEAIKIARKHRDQLLQGCKLLEALPPSTGDHEYEALQEQLTQTAPEVSQSAWGHKYFSLLYPDKLDDYHVEEYQHFHLIKLLQLPPEGNGRYLAAGRYVAIANELDMPINHLTTLLNQRNGRPYKYWKVLTNRPGDPVFGNIWKGMLEGGYIAIGWHLLGDLSDIGSDIKSKARVRSLMKEHYSDPGSWQYEIHDFVATIQEGDLVLAFEKSKVLGIGRVTGSYQYDPSTPRIPHHRPVEWLSDQQWELPEEEAKGRSIRNLKSHGNLLAIETRIFLLPSMGISTSRQTSSIPQLSGIPGRIQGVLDRKKQVILYGPPGTGKTYWASHTAQELSAYAMFGVSFSELTESQKKEILDGDSQTSASIRVCTFHPAYGYEDFLEGYRPVTINDQLVFIARSGIFKQICEDASNKLDQRFYLIIDEINRGDIPRIFGELLTILEADKRNMPVHLPLSGERFTVPPNVYLIGTMNTADRSIALLDTALRRRFGFIELMPDSTVLGNTMVGGIPLAPWLDALNERIMTHIGRDARNLQIGHAYLLDNGQPVSDFGRFSKIIQDDILPLLEEYCYEDYTRLAKILGNGLVDENHQRIRHELFDPARRDDLIQALLAPSPEIVASPQAVESEVDELENLEDDSDNQGVDQEPTP